MNDAITDALMEPMTVSSWLPPAVSQACEGQEHNVHRGMLKATRAILGDLQRIGASHATNGCVF